MLHFEGYIPPFHQVGRIIQISNLVARDGHDEMVRDEFGPRCWIITNRRVPLVIRRLSEDENRSANRARNRDVYFAELGAGGNRNVNRSPEGIPDLDTDIVHIPITEDSRMPLDDIFTPETICVGADENPESQIGDLLRDLDGDDFTGRRIEPCRHSN